MNDGRWLGWIILVVFLLVVRGFQARLRNKRAQPIDGLGRIDNGLARIDAAAQKILNARAANPIPRTASGPAYKEASKGAPKAARQRQPKMPAQKPAPALAQRREPAVIRRNALLSAGREPVIQRRR